MGTVIKKRKRKIKRKQKILNYMCQPKKICEHALWTMEHVDIHNKSTVFMGPVGDEAVKAIAVLYPRQAHQETNLGKH